MMNLDLNTVEYSFIDVCDTYDKINYTWKLELNEFGIDFTLENQLVHKSSYELLLAFKFKEVVSLNTSDNISKDIKDILIPLLNENIRLYGKYKDFFNKLERNKIQLETYRKNNKSFLSEIELKQQIVDCEEEMDKDEYYSSPFFNEIGFISEDYHFKIYSFSRHFLKDINEDFKKHLPYGNNNLIANKKEFFSYKIIGPIWEYSNKIFFEEISFLNFYKEFNFFHSVPKIKIKEDQIIYVCYLINKLSQTIENTKRRKVWEECINENLGININTYTSKRTHLRGSSSNEKAKSIADEIDKIINPFLPK